MSITLTMSPRGGGALVAPGLGAAPESRRFFVIARLGLAAGGLVAYLPYLAWRGASSPADALLLFGILAPLVGSVAETRGWRAGAVHAVAAAGVAALVLAIFSSADYAAWPAAIWLLAVPLNAVLSGSRPAALASGLVSALALLAVGFVSGPLPFQPAHPAAFASAFLILSALAEGVAGTLEHRRMAAARAVAPIERLDASVIEAAGDLVTWHGYGGDVTRALGAAGPVAGCAAADLVGGGLFERVHIPDRPAFLKAIGDAGVSDGPVTAEIRLQVPSGDAAGRGGFRLAWVEMRTARIGGTVVAFMRDASATHRQRAELEAARTEAEQANAMKGRFLATVSHELRTPLNAIIGFSELLATDHPYVLAEERRQEYATIIRDSGHHLLEVVNTLLDMSKIEGGNFPFALEPFALDGLAVSCCDLMGLKAEQAGIRLACRIEPDLAEIVGDRRACRQILINLLSNAVKFTPAGGTISLAVGRESGRFVLSVADSGIGIRAEDLPRLGDPFFQAGDMHRRPHEGTGLGLSVVRGLVGLHGGELSIEAGPGLGTTVTVSLPAVAAVAPPSGPVVVRARLRTPVPNFQRMSA